MSERESLIGGDLMELTQENRTQIAADINRCIKNLKATKTLLNSGNVTVSVVDNAIEMLMDTAKRLHDTVAKEV